MRSFHNKVKSSILQHAVHLSSTHHTNTNIHERWLLDVGVGRGGDMFKWDRCDIQNVIGFDPDESSINEANRRYLQSNLIVRNYNFIKCNDICELMQLQPVTSLMDVVSCQFAIHYLFSSVETLTSFVQNVSALLKPGGVFVGTFMDGEQVIKALNNDKFEFINSATLIYLPKPSLVSNDYGCPLKVHLTGTLFFGENSVSDEFLVKKEVLTRVCESTGLCLVRFKTFKQHHEDLFNEFKMTDDCKACSYMYTSFMFAKTI
jgi:mRNA (guanine-N7-)-methyltransferase